MSSLPRIASYLALFLAIAVGAQFLQSHLQHQSSGQLRALNAAAVETARRELSAAFAAAQLTATSPRSEFARTASLVGVTLEVGEAGEQPGDPGTINLLSFSMTPFESVSLHGWIPPPPAAKLLSVYHRVTAGLLLLCPLLFVVGVLLASLPRRPAKDERNSRAPWASVRAEAVGYEHLAKVSNERTQALELEQFARRRAEENSLVNRSMLDHSLSERVRLGRELHDNICQTLYAVCLTLESVHKKNTLAPELAMRVEQCMTELKRVNSAVRVYLQELGPDRVHEETFEQALSALLQSFAGREGVRIESRIAPDAITRIAPAHIAEIMNILREAISNALRHGQANLITIRAACDDYAVALSIHDNGSGFNPASREGPRGHGLGNMQKRAAELGGDIQLDSSPGKGTRVLLTVPVALSS